MLNGYYEIKTSGGIIDRKFRAENIGKYNGSIDLSNSEPTTLRNAAILFNNNYRNLGKKQNLTKRTTSTQSCNCKSEKIKLRFKIRGVSAPLLVRNVILIATLPQSKKNEIRG